MMRAARGGRVLGGSVLALGFGFLYLPILLLMVYSFNASRLATVWGGFSTRWYGELLRDRQLLDAAWVSLEVAFWTACASTVLGTMAAMAMVRMRRFPGKTLFGALITAPLVMPEVIIVCRSCCCWSRWAACSASRRAARSPSGWRMSPSPSHS